MERNQSELESITENLDEDYPDPRAKGGCLSGGETFASWKAWKKFKNLAELLNVDELHVSDSAGIIAYSSVPPVY